MTIIIKYFHWYLTITFTDNRISFVNMSIDWAANFPSNPLEFYIIFRRDWWEEEKEDQEVVRGEGKDGDCCGGLTMTHPSNVCQRHRWSLMMSMTIMVGPWVREGGRGWGGRGWQIGGEWDSKDEND